MGSSTSAPAMATLLLPAGEGGDLPCQDAFLAGHVHRVQRALDPTLDLGVGEVVAAAEAEGDVRADGGHDDLVVGILEHERARGLDAKAAVPGRARPAEGARERGLAAAVRAEEHESIPGGRGW